MRSAKLIRIESNKEATRGILTVNDKYICCTLERPWLDNQRNVSCIPSGSYICKRVVSPRFGDTFEITDVDGRTHILFHRGNFPHDTQGCVLLGRHLPHEKQVVQNSTAAFGSFLDEFPGEVEFRLKITNSWEL